MMRLQFDPESRPPTKTWSVAASGGAACPMGGRAATVSLSGTFTRVNVTEPRRLRLGCLQLQGTASGRLRPPSHRSCTPRGKAECMHASIACLLLYEDYVWVSLGNAMKAKQSKAKQSTAPQGMVDGASLLAQRVPMVPHSTCSHCSASSLGTKAEKSIAGPGQACHEWKHAVAPPNPAPPKHQPALVPWLVVPPTGQHERPTATQLWQRPRQPGPQQAAVGRPTSPHCSDCTAAVTGRTAAYYFLASRALWHWHWQ
jgi:hypothetical protein